MKYVARILFSLFLLVNALISIGCARQNFSEDSIPNAAGFASTYTTAYPGVVMVVSPGGTGLCTGAIVSRYAVMTATHCLLNSGTYTVYAKNGAFRSSNRQIAGTGSVNDTNDIGLLIFDQELTVNDAEIYGISNEVAQGDAVTVVGYGCDSVETRMNAGRKRAGSNRVADKSDFLRLLTPGASSAARNSRGIIGDANQAGTCFGDSGGPMFRASGADLQIAGVTHAGGVYGDYYVSEFVNVADNDANRRFLADANREFGLGIAGI
ncbi:S1 family peptidase [bacterium]|nr:S1 family peptidase [bacterium]